MHSLSNQPFLTHGDRNHMCLLLHGLGGGIYEMQLLAERLQKDGFSTCGILYPGHDQPSARMPNSRWEEWFSHVTATYQGLTQSYETISVIGFSTGCVLALKLAQSILSDRIQSLVLMAPYMRIRRYPLLPPPEVLVYSLGYVLNTVPRLSFPVNDPEMKQAIEAAAFFKTFNLSAVRSANSLIQQVKPLVSTVRLPTLIFQSTHDSVVDPAGAQWLCQELASPKKHLQWLTASDHIIPLDVEREQVFARTLGFLNALETSRDRNG